MRLRGALSPKLAAGWSGARGWGRELNLRHCHRVKCRMERYRDSELSSSLTSSSAHLRQDDMHVFELTRELIDIPSHHAGRRAGRRLSVRLFVAPLAALTAGPKRSKLNRIAERLRALRRSRCDALDAYGYRSALRAFARRRRVHLGPRRVRHQRHHRVHAGGRRELLERGVRNFGLLFVVARSATAPGPITPRRIRAVEIHHQWRTDREPARARVEGRIAI